MTTSSRRRRAVCRKMLTRGVPASQRGSRRPPARSRSEAAPPSDGTPPAGPGWDRWSPAGSMAGTATMRKGGYTQPTGPSPTPARAVASLQIKSISKLSMFDIGDCGPPQPPTSTPVGSLAGQCALDQPMPPAEFRLCGHAGRYSWGSYPATYPRRYPSIPWPEASTRSCHAWLGSGEFGAHRNR